MNIKEMTQWKCRRGHVLGVVQRARNGERRVTRLMLFRHAIDLSANGQAAEIDVMGNIEGTTLDVRCDAPGCGEVRSWFAGEDALERLVDATQVRYQEQAAR